MKSFYAYYVGQLEKILETNHVPVSISKAIGNDAERLLKTLLSINVRITKRYTNPRYYEEIKGIAKGANISAASLSHINIFPELIKAACSVVGVWGPATQGGSTLHLRSLDWDSSMPINKYPLITVYHPSKGNVHSNLGWVGLIGSLTGASPHLSIGEKQEWAPAGKIRTTRYGNPWTYVVRDVLYDTSDLASAHALLKQTDRTCAIFLGIGSAVDHSFLFFDYSYKILTAYDDKNYTHYDKNHLKKAGIAYVDKNVQPSDNSCIGDVLTGSSLYGKWNIENLWRSVGLSHQTGDTQLAVFDLERQLVYLSYSQFGGAVKAFQRSPISINLGYFYGQTWPQIIAQEV